MKKTPDSTKEQEDETLPRNVTPLPEPRRPHRGRRRLLVLAVAAVCVLAVALNWDKISPSAVIVTFQAFFGEFGESQFPVQLSQGSFRGAAPIGPDIAIVTDTRFLVYTSTGRQIAGRQHGLSNPRIVTNGSRAVIYDAGGKQLKSETRFAEPFSATMDFPITTAAVSRTGTVAVATSSENYLSEMTVFGPSGNHIFNWDCADGRILALALSPDGSHCAASVVLSSGGDIESILYIYDLSKQTPLAAVKFPGTLLFSVTYRSSSRILGVGDNRAVSLDANGGQAGSYAYGDHSLKCYDAEPSSTVLVFSRYGVGQDSTIVSLSADAKAQATVNTGRNIKLIAGGDKVAALSTTGLLFFNTDLSGAGMDNTTGDISQMITMGGYAYSFTPTTAYQYKAG